MIWLLLRVSLLFYYHCSLFLCLWMQSIWNFLRINFIELNRFFNLLLLWMWVHIDSCSRRKYILVLWLIFMHLEFFSLSPIQIEYSFLFFIEIIKTIELVKWVLFVQASIFSGENNFNGLNFNRILFIGLFK